MGITSKELTDSPAAFPGIAVALIGLLVISPNPFARFECWHVWPV